MSADAQQLPTVVSGHAVGLRAREGRQGRTQRIQGLKGLHGGEIRLCHRLSAVLPKARQGLINDLPSFVGQTFTHRKCSLVQGAQIEADAGDVLVLVQRLNQGALKDAPSSRPARL